MAFLPGVFLTPRSVIPTDGGKVLRVLRADDEVFQKFGEVYVSAIEPGAVKGWKRHKKSASNMAVPVGRIFFILRDERADSPARGAFQEGEIGEDAYQLLTVPPGVLYAWKNIGGKTAFVLNCASEMWSAEENETVPLDSVPYVWPV